MQANQVTTPEGSPGRTVKEREREDVIKPEVSQRPPAEVFAQKAALNILDPRAFVRFLHGDAERKNKGPGSAIKMLERMPEDPFENALIKETIFFHEDDIGALSKTFPDDMWGQSRMPKRIKYGLGCLVVLQVEGREGNGLCAFVVKKVGTEYKIVYLDDN
jgi:hypothetical protein